jgi:uncharacterized membrane protein
MRICRRSLAKSFSWRILATLTTTTLVYLVTGTITIALEVGFLEMTAKIILYYVHEHAWKKVSWHTA